MVSADPFIEINPSPLLDPEPILEKAFAKYDLGRLGGRSEGYGWSIIKAWQQCPKLYQLSYRRLPIVPAEETVRIVPPGLLIGGLFHCFLGLYYAQRIVGWEVYRKLKHEWLVEFLLSNGCDFECVNEAQRLFNAYLLYYSTDYWTPISVEHGDKWAWRGIDFSCRYDALAEVGKNNEGITPGLWIVEHKTTQRMDEASMHGWHGDGEVIGQQWIYHQNGHQYGELKGTIVNLVSKAKEPKVHREIVPFQKHLFEKHHRDLTDTLFEIELYEHLGRFPRRRAACIHRYGKCGYYDACADAGEE